MAKFSSKFHKNESNTNILQNQIHISKLYNNIRID